MSTPLVVLDHVDKWFGELHVLQDINLSIAKGEVVVVIGPSGSGKSTLCRTINRLETVDKGSITLDGSPLPAEGKALASHRAEVGIAIITDHCHGAKVAAPKSIPVSVVDSASLAE